MCLLAHKADAQAVLSDEFNVKHKNTWEQNKSFVSNAKGDELKHKNKAVLSFTIDNNNNLWIDEKSISLIGF